MLERCTWLGRHLTCPWVFDSGLTSFDDIGPDPSFSRTSDLPVFRSFRGEAVLRAGDRSDGIGRRRGS
jgi:hypothetical protein